MRTRTMRQGLFIAAGSLLCYLLGIFAVQSALSTSPGTVQADHILMQSQPGKLLHTSSASTLPTAVNNDEEVVYLDVNGYLRIWDPVPDPNEPITLTWVSPIGGWRDFALADFNLDGDMEIVAVGGENDSGRLTIYDPIILDKNAINVDRITNDIPWDILYEAPLLGRPILVNTGDFNLAIPGEEIAFVFALNDEDKLDSDDKTRISFLQALIEDGSELPDGRAWESAADDVDFGNTWERLTLGDLDADEQAEIVLVDDGVGVVRIYRLDGRTPVKIYENESGNRPWQDATVAAFIPSSLQQVALARSSTVGSSTFWVLYYNPGDETGFSDSYHEFLLPPPRVIFHGDVNNNGDDELFLLRQVPNATLPNSPRLIMRNAGDDLDMPIFEQLLDPDNGYRAGAAGDIDGDSRAEVVVMRDNKIRAYTAPESSAAALPDFSPPVTTDQRTIHVGNLDRNGYLQLPRLGVTTIDPQNESVPESLVMGEVIAESSNIIVRNANAENVPDPIAFTLSATDDPEWLILNERSGNTQAEIPVGFDARFLQSGSYSTQILITTSDLTVRNMPVAIDVTLNVRPGLAPAEYAVTAVYPCTKPVVPQEYLLALNGPDNLAFSAQIMAGQAAESGDVGDADGAAIHVAALTGPAVIWPTEASWVTASSPNILPATVKLVFDPTQLPAGTELGHATLELVFFNTDGRQERNVDLTLTCAHPIYLPLVAR